MSTMLQALPKGVQHNQAITVGKMKFFMTIMDSMTNEGIFCQPYTYLLVLCMMILYMTNHGYKLN